MDSPNDCFGFLKFGPAAIDTDDLPLGLSQTCQMTALTLSHPVFLRVLLVAWQKEIIKSDSEHTMKLVRDDPEDHYRPAASIHSKDIRNPFAQSKSGPRARSDKIGIALNASCARQAALGYREGYWLTK